MIPSVRATEPGRAQNAKSVTFGYGIVVLRCLSLALSLPRKFFLEKNVKEGENPVHVESSAASGVAFLRVAYFGFGALNGR